MNTSPSALEELTEYLSSFETFYLIGHIDPDADCLGSSLALGHFFERQGKLVRYFNAGPFDRPEIRDLESFFLPRIDPACKLSDPKPVVIILDCSGPDRIGEDLQKDLAELPLVIIDHHATSSGVADHQYVDSSAPATAVLVQRVIEHSGEAPDAFEARYLFLGFCTDTGFFRHLESNGAESVAAAARLMESGASPRETYHKIFGGQSFVSRKLLGRLLERAESHFDGQLLMSYQTRADIEELGHGARDSATLYEMLLGVEGVRAIAFLREDENGNCTGSLRSVDSTDVSIIAAVFGGGGHRRASGFLINSSWRDVRKALLSEFAEHFDTFT